MDDSIVMGMLSRRMRSSLRVVLRDRLDGLRAELCVMPWGEKCRVRAEREAEDLERLLRVFSRPARGREVVVAALPAGVTVDALAVYMRYLECLD